MGRSSKYYLRAGLVWPAIILAAAVIHAQPPSVSTYPELVKQARIKSTGREPALSASLWERALSLNPHDGRSWREYGAVLLELKDYRKAVAAYEKAYKLGAGYPWEQSYSIARCYALAGEKELTLRFLERAVNEGHRNRTRARAR